MPSFAQPDLQAERTALRRAAQQSRVSRILNSRTRAIGVDIDALRKQVEENRARELASKEEDMTHVIANREAFAAVSQAEALEDVERRARDAANAAVWDEQLDRSRQYMAAAPWRRLRRLR